MRRLRMAVGLAVVVCTLGVLAAPALAKRQQPHATFGKFVASRSSGVPISPADPATASTVEGSVSELSLAEGALNIGEEKCAKVKSTGQVTSPRSEEIQQEVTFSKCEGTFPVSQFAEEEAPVPSFKLTFVFRSNQSAGFEAGESELGPNELTIATRKRGGCVIRIPRQTVPAKEVRKTETEFEAASYSTEHNEPVKLKKFPKGFQEKLEIDVELEKVESILVPSPRCHIYPAFKTKKGIIEFELEEIKIRNGNIGFETKAEVEAEG